MRRVVFVRARPITTTEIDKPFKLTNDQLIAALHFLHKALDNKRGGQVDRGFFLGDTMGAGKTITSSHDVRRDPDL